MFFSFKNYFSSKILKVKKKNRFTRRLALLYIVSTKNNTVATVIDYKTKKTLVVMNLGYALKRFSLSRAYRQSTPALRVFGSEIPHAIDLFFRREKLRIAEKKEENKKFSPLLLGLKDTFKLLVYFKGPARHRWSIMREVLKRYQVRKISQDESTIWKKLSVVYFVDITNLPHNGCRAKKQKRTRSKRKPRIIKKR